MRARRYFEFMRHPPGVHMNGMAGSLVRAMSMSAGTRCGDEGAPLRRHERAAWQAACVQSRPGDDLALRSAHDVGAIRSEVRGAISAAPALVGGAQVVLGEAVDLGKVGMRQELAKRRRPRRVTARVQDGREVAVGRVPLRGRQHLHLRSG